LIRQQCFTFYQRQFFVISGATEPDHCRSFVDSGRRNAPHVVSYDLTPEYFEDYAELADVELLKIGADTTIDSFKKDLRLNEVYYLLNRAVKIQ
jgi:hypothetical protein